MTRNRRIAASGVVAICLVSAALFFSDRILWVIGNVLVNTEAPSKADIVVVIGGDLLGNRIIKAAELIRDGYAPKVLASGSGDIYGNFESDVAVDYAVQHGYPRDRFISFRYPALSTSDEAAAVTRELRRLGVHKFLLVTSEYHTARAGRIFRRLARGLEMHVVGAPDPWWANGEWWKTREGRKIWFMEASKTVAEAFGI